MLEELKALCREEGCDAVFLPGNHDPSWPGDGYLELAGGKIVVTHGDTLLRSGAPWKREMLLYPQRVEQLWEARPAAATDPVQRHQLARDISLALPVSKHSKGRKFTQRACDAIHPPQRALEMLKAWFTQPVMGAAYRDTYFPEAEFLIIGHFHWAGSWLSRGLRVINTGSFLNPGHACWVEVEGGAVSYGRVDEKKDGCRKGAVLGSWRI
jgi:predicted phosphodiesterase